MTRKGTTQEPTLWTQRLRFTPPHDFVWNWAPPGGYDVGDSALIRIGGRYFVRSINGANVPLDKVGALFDGYRPPVDQKPVKPRRKTTIRRSKHGVSIRAQCEQFGIHPQTYYARRRTGMEHEMALTATQSEVYAWRRARDAVTVRRDPVPLAEWQEAAKWFAQMNFDRWMAPLGFDDWAQHRLRGLTAKQAIMQNEKPHSRAWREENKSALLDGVTLLEMAMPEVQRRLGQGEVDQGVLLTAKLLGVVRLVTGSEGALYSVPEAVIGNAVLAVLRSVNLEK